MRYVLFLFMLIVTAIATAAMTEPPPPEMPSDLATEYPQPEPVLHAYFNAEDRGHGRVLFTVYDEDGSILIADAEGSTARPGEDSTYTIPAEILNEGILYSWTARAVQDGRYSPATELETNFVAVSEIGEDDRGYREDIHTTARQGKPLEAYPSNPWGCKLALSRYPRPASSGNLVNITSTVDTDCSSPLFQVTSITHDQWLARSSWRGWITEARNISVCDSRTASYLQEKPVCNYGDRWDRMRATVVWNCYKEGHYGARFNYRVIDKSKLHVGNNSWSAQRSWQTGPSNKTASFNEPNRCGHYMY